MLLYTFLGTAGALGFTGVFMAISADNLTTPLNASQITTTIVSSCLLALIGYTFKKTLWQCLKQPQNAERDDEVTQLLASLNNI